MSTATISDSETRPGQRHLINSLDFQTVLILLLSSQAAIGLAVAGGWFWLAALLVLPAAHLMHGTLIGYHEASHGLLRRSRWLNEFDGVLIGVFSFLPFSLYRVVHQLHHVHLTGERDEEFWPLVDPGVPRWARQVAAFLELNVGLIFSPLIFLRAFLRPGSRIRSEKVRRRIWAELLLTVVMWTGVLWAVAHFDGWKYFLWTYLAPAALAANLQSWRKYIEHVGLTGSTVNSSTRSVVPETRLSRFVAFTLLHEPYHGIHHQNAGLPHRILPRHTSMLVPEASDELPPFPSYWSALWDLIRSLTDPRVGPQWRTLPPHPSEARV